MLKCSANILLSVVLMLFATQVFAQDTAGNSGAQEYAGLVARINLENSSEIEEALL